MQVPVEVDTPFNLVLRPTKIQIAAVNVVPYTSANIIVNIYYEEESDSSFMSEDNRIKYTNVFMDTEDYLKWQNDDNYVVDYTLAKLGMKRAESS